MYSMNKTKISDFSKAEIMSFLNQEFQNDFEERFLKGNIDYLFSILSDKELIIYIKNARICGDELFKKVIEQYIEKKEILKELKKDRECNRYFLKDYQEIIQKKIEVGENDLLEFLLPFTIYSILISSRENDHRRLILKDLLYSKEHLEHLIKYTIYSINVLNPQVFKMLSHSPYYQELYQKYLIHFINKILDSEQFSKIIRNISNENQDLLNTVILIIEDTCRLAGKEIWDIRYFEYGSYNRVYKVGNYVLKIGEPRLANQIPLDENMLYPICRKYIKEFDLFIEVSSLEDKENISQEDMYQVFKRYRDNGKFWVDVKEENLVRLKRDNASLYPFEIEPETLGFIGEKSGIQRKKGECVLCDTDAVYYEDKVPWEKIQNLFRKDIIENFKEMENRYQQELLQRKKSTFKR